MIRALLWSLIGAAVAVAIGWAAAQFHAAGRAPIVLLPFGIGLALGAILRGLAHALELKLRPALVAGVVFLALVAVVAQHAWLYQDFRRQWREARAGDPRIAMFRPESPWSPKHYFEREATPHRAALWAVDAAFVITGALGAVYVARRVVTEHRTLNPEP